MKKLVSILVLAFIFVQLNNINAQCNHKTDSTKSAVKNEKVMLCGKCGHIKGTEQCCKADAETCDKCGLHKGAPGCCKIEKGEDIQLCSKCGEIKGKDKCCKADAEKCGKCGLNKGAPGCCKLPKKEG